MAKPLAIVTDKAPQAIGPYSQGVRIGDFLFISGQIPLEPESGQIVGESIQVQTEQVLKNLRSILESENLSFENVVKTTIYLKNLGDFSIINDIYKEFVSEPFPARATVEVSALPKNALVEIEAIACYPKS